MNILRTMKNKLPQTAVGKRLLAFTLATAMVVTATAAYAISAGMRDVTSYADSSVVTADQEMRGIWISMLDYQDLATPDPGSLMVMADTMLDNCKAMGMNAVFLHVRPYADAIYPSSYYPWSACLTGTQGLAPYSGFDPLEYFIEGAHARGMELHAWINPYRITKKTDNPTLDGLAASNPALGAYSQYVVLYDNAYYFDPGQPAVRDLIVQGALEIVNNYDVDGIHMDDYFYPGTGFDDAATFATYGAGFSSLADWRRDNVNQLVSTLDAELHAADPDLSFGISPTGIWANAKNYSQGSNTGGYEHYTSRYADSVTWIRQGWVDYIAPQIYWEHGHSLADFTTVFNWWANICSGTDVKFYVGMADYRSAQAISSGDTSSAWYGTDELRAQLDNIKNNSVACGAIHFRYNLMQNCSDIRNLYAGYYATPSPATDPATTDPVTEPTEEPVTEPVQEPDPGTGSTPVFPDIAGNWAESYITVLARDGIISGMEDGTFKPFNPVTRAQFVKLLAGVAGADTNRSAAGLGFSDVKDSDWYAGCVAWAVGSGVASGTGIDTFDPDEVITREQMAKMIMSFARAQGITLSQTSFAIDFADADSISSWAVDYVDAAVRAGIINGSDTTDSKGATVRVFKPAGTATRAEASKVICKVRDAARA